MGQDHCTPRRCRRPHAVVLQVTNAICVRIKAGAIANAAEIVLAHAVVLAVPDAVLVEVRVPKPCEQTEEVANAHHIVPVFIKWGAHRLLRR